MRAVRITPKIIIRSAFEIVEDNAAMHAAAAEKPIKAKKSRFKTIVSVQGI